MGALTKIGNALSRLGTVLRGGEMSFGTWSGVSGRSYSRSGARNNPGERVEAAHNNSRLWSAINRISLDMACSELYVATRSGSKIQRRYDGPLNEWMANPWRGMGGGSMFSLLYLTQFSLETCREAFWLIIGASPEQGVPPQEVWPIPAHWVFSLPRDNFPFYGLTPGGAKTEIPTWVPAAEMCHFRMPNAIDPFGRGCSAPWAIDDEVVFGDESNKYLNSFFRNNARPDLVFFIENATHQQAQELRANWERRHRGSLNSHRIEVLPATGRIEQMATSFADMTLVDLKRLNRDEIWQHFGLSPEIMGAVENSNRASIEAASYHHSLYNRMPRLTFFVQEFNRLMAPMFTPRGRRHLLMFENPVRETEEFKLEKTIQGWANGLVARGEARQALGHDEFGDGRDNDIGQPLNTALIGPDNVPRGLPKPTDSGAKPASKPPKKAKNQQEQTK